jgi:hypothetical protein
MPKDSRTILAVVALTFSVAQSQALQISGSIQLAPTKTISVTPNLWSGVANVTVDFQAGPNAIVTDATATTGDFSVILAAPPYDVTFLDFTTGGAAVPNLWSIAGGPSFDLTTAWNLSTGNLFLTVYGIGVLHAPGYDDTIAYFTLQADRTDPTAQTKFYFSASNSTVPTPDGGATAMLCGLGLIVLGAVARRNA